MPMQYLKLKVFKNMPYNTKVKGANPLTNFLSFQPSDMVLLTLSMVQSRPMWTKVLTELNPQVLGSVPCEGGPDPYLQVRGSNPVRTWCGPQLLKCHLCHTCHITTTTPRTMATTAAAAAATTNDNDNNHSCTCSSHHQR